MARAWGTDFKLREGRVRLIYGNMVRRGFKSPDDTAGCAQHSACLHTGLTPQREHPHTGCGSPSPSPATPALLAAAPVTAPGWSQLGSGT